MDYIVVSAPQIVFGLAAFIFLVFYVFKINISWLNKTVLAVAAIVAISAAVFTYLYSTDAEVFSNGFIARRAGLFVFFLMAFLVLFSLKLNKFSEYFFLSISSFMFIFALALYGSGIVIQMTVFFVADIFVILFKDREIEIEKGLNEDVLIHKILNFIPAIVFMTLFVSNPQDLKIQKMAFNGMIFMLILTTLGSFFTTTKRELPRLKQVFMQTGQLISFVPVLTQFVILTFLIMQNKVILLGSFMTLTVIFLLLGASFKSVTEEKYALFVLRDVYLLFFLGLLGVVSSSLTQKDIVIYGGLFILQIAFALNALGGINSAKQTMAAVKYSFEKIPNNSNLFLSVSAGFCAELYMIALIYNNMNSDSLTHAILLIGAAFYSPALFNKLFTLFSMAKRIKGSFKRIFNVNSLIMLLFFSVAVAMLYKW